MTSAILTYEHLGIFAVILLTEPTEKLVSFAKVIEF